MKLTVGPLVNIFKVLEVSLSNKGTGVITILGTNQMAAYQVYGVIMPARYDRALIA